MKEKEENIIANWLEDSISDTELNTQYDADMSNDLRMICDVTENLDIPQLDSKALLDKIKIDITSKKKTFSLGEILYLKYWVSGIAALLIGIVCFITLLNPSVSIDNNTLSYAMHSLPDGSTIHLNANSHIEYHKDFMVNRNITLDGEAFFEVQKGETFIVHTANGDITVIGTSFNVFSRGNNLTVACKTGRVKVATQVDNILNPVDKVISIKGELLEESTVDTKQIDSWRTGESTFKSSPLSVVLQAITAQYDYEIKGNYLDLTQRFTGSFIHHDIDKALRMVLLPMEIPYKLDKQDRIITIQ